MSIPRVSAGLLRNWRILAASFAAALALALVLNVIWWSLLSPSARPPAKDLIIPRGTAAAVEQGALPPFIPSILSLRQGALIRVRNDDVVPHRVGTATIPAETTVVIVPELQADQLVCSVHPSGYLGVSLIAKPGAGAMVLPTLLAGLPLGIVTALVILIARKLDGEPLQPLGLDHP